MKKVLLSALTSLMFVGSASALDATFVIWDSTTGATKQGCTALVNYAKQQGIQQTGDNYQLPFTTITDEQAYELTFTSPVTVKAGDAFCLHIGEKWIHSSLTFPNDPNQWFEDETNGPDIKFNKDFEISKITLNMSHFVTTFNLVFTGKETGGEIVDPKPIEDGNFFLRYSLANNWSGSDADKYPLIKDEDGSYYVNVDIDTTGKSGDDLQFAIGSNSSDQNGWNKDYTIVAGSSLQAQLGENQCFLGGNRNVLFPADCHITKIILKKVPTNNGDYASETYVPSADKAGIIILIGTRDNAQSNYLMEVWAMDEDRINSANPWDMAGGLYRPFREDAQKFELDDKYKKDINYGSETIHYLCFNGPLTEEEIAQYPNARKYTWGDNFEAYKDKLGFGDTAPESDSELYVIDFCSEANPDGLYLITPNRNEMDKVDESIKDLHPFYRTGVRFGFFDNSYPLQNTDNGNETALLSNYFRYQKWGHVFRLNEVARPVNAFARYDANGNVVGFDDKFGPAMWNGIDASTWNGADQKGNDFINSDRTTYWNKKGDCRILAEHNFWLRRIFLEVATDKYGHKHFYMSFIGTPDLMAGSEAQNVEYYVPADQDIDSHKNFVNGMPNIFPGVDIQTNEMGFQRYFNLNRENCEEMIGFKPENYPWDENGNLLNETVVQQTMGKYLYNLNLQDGYEVTSTYVVKDADGNTVEVNGRDLTRTIRYRGQNGGYYQYNADTDAFDIPLETKTGDKIEGLDKLEDLTNPELKIFIEPLTTSLLFDPEDPKRPTELVITNNYKFDHGSQAEGMNYERVFPINISHEPSTNEIPVTVEAGDFTHKVSYTSNVDWSNFETLKGDKGYYPVTGYTVTAVGTEEILSDDHSDNIFDNGSIVENTPDWATSSALTIGDHTYNYRPSAANAFEEKIPVYQMHYKVESQYNYAYVQGVAEKTDLPEAAYSNTAVDENGYVTLDNGLKYQIRPEAVTGKAHATFETTTSIDEIAADNDAEAVYYNLQGVKVDNPANGVFIKVVGQKATKVAIP